MESSGNNRKNIKKNKNGLNRTSESKKKKRKSKISKSSYKKIAAIGLASTILGGGILYSISKNGFAKNGSGLSSSDGKIYLVDVTDEDSSIYITDINGNNIEYDFDNNTVAMVGAKKAKTKDDKMYEVMLVDGDSNITYGLMDGKYLSDKSIDKVKVLNNSYDKYIVNSSCQMYDSTSTDDKNFNLQPKQQLIVSDKLFKSTRNDDIWNEAIFVDDGLLRHGFIMNDNISYDGANYETNSLGNDVFFVNTSYLNVRMAHSTDSKIITSIDKNSKVYINNEYDSFEDGTYKWVYITFSDSDGNLCNGWVAAVDYSCDTPINYLCSASENMDDLVNAYSAVVYSVDDGSILYGKNESDVLNPASITKVLTAYIVAKYGNLNDKITYSENAIDAGGYRSQGYGLAKSHEAVFHIVKLGNKISVRDALHISLLYSENCTTVALAEYIESITGRKFADIMNEEAKNMGCTSSHFTNSFGAYDEKHYVTAVDMARIVSTIVKDSPIAIGVMGTTEYNLEYDDTCIRNQSDLLHPSSTYYIPEAIGCKTGWINESGHTMVSAYEKDGKSYVVVTLEGRRNNREGKFQDAKLLAEYAFSLNKSNSKVYKRY